jgi:tetratricopeptide (TPR) repeat protein
VAFDIARRVGGTLESRAVSPQRSGQQLDAAAYESYLRGRYFWNRRTKEAAEKAVGYFEQAIAAAPDYAPAYAGLADCYTLGDGRLLGLPRREAYGRATRAVLKALEIDERLAEAHVSLGAIKFHDWDWQGAEREFKRAIELNPNSALAYQWYGELLSALARHDEAVWAMERAQSLDPLELMVNGDLAWVYYMARRYDRALGQIQKTLELDPQMVWMHNLTGSVYRTMGLEKQAVEAYKKAMILSGARPRAVSHIADISGLYRWWLKQAGEGRREEFPLVTVYAALGQNDKAIGLLEEAYRERHSLLWVKVAPGFDRLRKDSRFIALLRRLGLES